MTIATIFGPNGTALERPTMRMRCLFSAAAVCALGLMSAPDVLAAKAPVEGEKTSMLRARALPIAETDSYTYHSRLMNRDYDVIVSVPREYASNPQKNYPALLLTDGHDTFPVAFGAWNYLAQSQEIDQPILISIGSPLEEGHEASYRRRVHEFSPPNWPMTDTFGQVVAGMVAEFCKAEHGPTDPKSCVGGAPKFFEFITAELLPTMFERYRIDSDDLGLYGHSAGGFFASWVIFQGDSRFKRFIISSPAMAYGDGEIFRKEEKYAADHKDLAARIYLASGTLEMQNPFLEGLAKVVSGQVHLGAMLAAREYPNLKVLSEIHQNLGHVDVPGVALSRGLRFLYGKEPIK
jgi:uncharacterized protein